MEFSRILVDVNVCLDLLLEEREAFRSDAVTIFQASENGDIEAVVSPISYDTMFYLMRPKQTVREATGKLKDLSAITHTALVGNRVIQSALSSGWNDMEDAIQYFSGVLNNCDMVITRNESDFNPDSIPVLSPKEYIASYL